MSPELYILTISLLPVTAIIVFSMKYASSYAAARARLIEQSEIKAAMSSQVDQLAQIATLLRRIEVDMSQQSVAVADVHAILKQVG